VNELGYLARKVVACAASYAMLLAIGFVIFSLMPSDPVAAITRGRPVTPAQQLFLRHQLGLDQPSWQRFATYAVNTAQGKLGYSWQFQQPVANLIGQRMFPTLLLTGTATTIATALGLWLGVRAGWHPRGIADRAATSFSFAFWSLPTFWLGMILLVVFTAGVGPVPSIFPAGGMSTPGTPGGLVASHIADVAWHLVLPCVTLVLVILAQYVAIMRASVVDQLGSPYLLTARAKGLRDVQVRNLHAAPNALLPAITIIFLQLGGLVGGAITIETVFSWPGMGYLTFQALQIPDLPLLQGTFLIFGASVIGMNMLADVIYRYLDPRIRRQ
jgi:peptide/nickel transport system permease protein